MCTLRMYISMYKGQDLLKRAVGAYICLYVSYVSSPAITYIHMALHATPKRYMCHALYGLVLPGALSSFFLLSGGERGVNNNY